MESRASGDDARQVKCLIASSGHLWMRSDFDRLPAPVRQLLAESRHNICAACLRAEAARRQPNPDVATFICVLGEIEDQLDEPSDNSRSVAFDGERRRRKTGRRSAGAPGVSRSRSPAAASTTKTAWRYPMTIPFTQYLRPNGRKRPVEIDRPEEIEAIAHRFIESGGRYECEELTTGHASLTAVKFDRDVCIELCMNGPAVPAAVDALVRKSERYIEASAASRPGICGDNRGGPDPNR
jgi:hypothetical protein